MKKNHKKLLVMLLCTAIFLLLCSAGMADSAAHTHGVNQGNSGEHAGWTGISSLSEITGTGNYYLTGNINLTDYWETPGGTINLCLNGYHITGEGIAVANNATLNLFDEKGNTGTTLNLYAGSVLPTTPGNINMYGGTVSSGSRNTSGIFVRANGTFNMYGGIITNSNGNSGGGVRVCENSIFNLYDGIITGNHAYYGGGVWVDVNSIFNMYGGQISGNSASDDIGGVKTKGTFSMSGGTIKDNNGKNVFIENGTFIRTAGTIGTDGNEDIYYNNSNTAKITFDANGGSGTMYPQYISQSTSTALVANAFTYTGKTFQGWKDSSGNFYADQASLSVDDDLELIAKWDPFSVTVSVDPQNAGSVTGDGACNYGTDVSLSASPASGYQFVQWTEGQTPVGTDKDYTITRIDKDHTLVANFELIPATAPTFTTQPKDLIIGVGYGEGYALTAETATIADHTITYQWYSNTDKTNTGGSAISGATSSTFAIPTGKALGTEEYYYCVATSTPGNGNTAFTASNAVYVKITELETFTVTFTVTGGAWDDKNTENKEVALSRGKGEDKLLVLETSQIPTPGEPATGYKGPGSWNEDPTIYVKTGSKAITENKTFTYSFVAKKLITPAVSMGSYTYGATPVTPTVIGNTGNGTVTYYCGTDNSSSGGTVWIPGTTLDAGDYYLYAEVAETEEYIPAVTGAVPFTVSKRDVTLSSSDGTKTYDGKALTKQDVTVSGSGFVDGEISGLKAVGSVVDVEEGEVRNSITWTANAGFKESNYDISRVEGVLKITPATVTLTAQGQRFTYNGEAQRWPEYDVEGLIGEDQITATVTGSITYPGDSPQTNAISSYTFTIGKPGNYSVETKPGTLTMTQASKAITITAASGTWTYDGKPHSDSEVTVTEGTLFNGDSLVATAGGSETYVADSKAGNNPVQDGWKVMNGTTDVTDNYVITPVAGTLTVVKAESSVTLPAAKSGLTYNGGAQALVTAGTAEGGTMQYAFGQNAETAPTAGWSVAVPAASDAGTYYVWYMVQGDENHLDTKAYCVPATIAKAAATVTADAKSKVYGETDPELTATLIGVIDGDTLNYTLARAEGENAGEYMITATPGENPNYDVTAADGKFTITRKSIEEAVLTLDRTQLTYNGTEQVVAVTGVSVDGMTLTADDYTVSGEKGTDTGTYAVTVTGKGNFTGSASTEWKIVEKAMTVSSENVTATYDGKAYGVTVRVEDPTSGAVVQYGKTAGTYDLDESPTLTDAGTMAVYYKATAANYTDYTGIATVTIGKASATVTAETKTKIYGETDPELTAVVTGVIDGDTLNYTLTRAEGENVGEYAITATPGENPNYDVTAVAGKLTIASKEMTVHAEDVNVDFDGQAHGITVQVDDPADGAVIRYGTEEGTYDLDACPTITEAGTTMVYYQVTAGNYTDFTGSATVTVQPAYHGLTIRYVYADGTMAAESSSLAFQEGKPYAVTSPKITGYTADPAKVSGVTGTEDIEATVVYRAAKTATKSLDYHATLLPAEDSDTALILRWREMEGAAGYLVSFGPCDGKAVHAYDTVMESEPENSYTFKGLEAGKPYKAKVQAVNAAKEPIGKASFLVHASTGGSLKMSTDAKRVTAGSKKLVLETGEIRQLEATAEGYKDLALRNHTGEALTWYSGNSNIASVSKDGKVTGKAPGTCTIYVIANDGVEDSLQVTVGAYDLALPASAKTVSESAMEGIAAKGVYVGDKCTEIKSQAFADCGKLEVIRLPKDCAVAADAFDGCGKLKTVVAPAGGTAEKWAREMGLVFVDER